MLAMHLKNNKRLSFKCYRYDIESIESSFASWSSETVMSSARIQEQKHTKTTRQRPNEAFSQSFTHIGNRTGNNSSFKDCRSSRIHIDEPTAEIWLQQL